MVPGFYRKKSRKTSKKTQKTNTVDKNRRLEGIKKTAFFVAIPIIK
jgi:hypothetical protein